MILSLIPSAAHGGIGGGFQYLTTLIVNRRVAVDAGALGVYGTPKEQAEIRHVFLTHTHLDHVATLPIFVENIFLSDPSPVCIHGSTPVFDCLQKDIFNNRIWPDFIALSQKPESPFLRMVPHEPGQTAEVEGLKITAISLNHVVPTVGYIIDDGKSAVGYVSDTAATDEIWDRLNQCPNLKAVLIEVTFPNDHQWLADISKHLTPANFKDEVAKLKKPVPILALHVKARFNKQVVKEVLALQLPQVEFMEFNKVYEF